MSVLDTAETPPVLWKAKCPLEYDESRAGKLRFVVSGAATSGTLFISHILSQMGLLCGHEELFGLPHSLSERELMGEASWLSLPALPLLPENVILLHQVRNPIKVISSVMRKHIFIAKDNEVINEYGLFALKNMDMSPFVDFSKIYIQYWTKWNQMIEMAGKNRPYFCYRLEDVVEEGSHVLKTLLLDVLGERMDERKNAVINSIAKDYKEALIIKDIDLPRSYLPEGEELNVLMALAEKYGYSREELNRLK